MKQRSEFAAKWGGRVSVVGLFIACFQLAITPATADSRKESFNQTPRSHRSARTVPEPLPDHPGNIFLEGEKVVIPVPGDLPPTTTSWRLLDDRLSLVRTGELARGPANTLNPIPLDGLGIGWYRLEFVSPGQTNRMWTSLAVLRRLRVPVPTNSPIAVDSAAAWFAPNDPARQRKLANLAALAGVSWVRDRLRWQEIQPVAGPLRPAPTTYDTSADAHRAEDLQVLQVFHDTPQWAREEPDAGGRFAPDLRRVFEFSRALAQRFKGRVAAWEPWNEANIAMFGGHTVDQMCSWQKAAWLGFKSADPGLIVGWNVTAASPTPAHTTGVLANETWPYFDTYNIHSYDWPHSYLDLWKPAREAAAGRPIWITEADRGTPHLKNPPWYDQDPHLEQLKAQWIAQSFASSLFAGASRHFHFILGNYQEANGVQFGLLRYDLTPRPAYLALATVGRCLAGAKILGRWQPARNAHVYVFRAQPDGILRDVLVAWAEKEADWDGRGKTTVGWQLPSELRVEEVVDYLGRPLGGRVPDTLTSDPIFVFLRRGDAESLPYEPPPPLASRPPLAASPLVLQLCLPRSAEAKVEDLPWSEGFAHRATPGESLEFKVHAYNFGFGAVTGSLRVLRQPADWQASIEAKDFKVAEMDRSEFKGTLLIPSGPRVRDGWVVLGADCGPQGKPVLAFRVLAR